MSENPYRSPSTGGASPRTRSTRWLVWSGAVCLGLASLCLSLTVVGMIVSFHTIAQSQTPNPADLAHGIRMSMLATVAGMPLGIVGVGLLIAGLIIRRPVE
ncbi:MAG TPA: MotA/TolQ/ExbB proton channel family protein [Thermoguttaceae bacterium]|nr:MotA/TolQ/ExbB proton channel family protein [Thermoguttaceae bacterium]